MKLLFFMALAAISFGQNVPLNQFDDAGKKHGKWMLYLNKDWEKINDSSGAVFFRYNFYDHGTSLYPMGKCGGKGYKLEIKANEGSTSKFLDGEYKWLDSKGRLSSVHILKNGVYISCKEYYSSGELSQHFDYTKNLEGHEHSWHISIYDKNGNVKLTYYFCKDKEGNWPRTKG